MAGALWLVRACTDLCSGHLVGIEKTPSLLTAGVYRILLTAGAGVLGYSS